MPPRRLIRRPAAAGTHSKHKDVHAICLEPVFAGRAAVFLRRAPRRPPRNVYDGYQIIRRNGAVVRFEPAKISVAMMKAFLAVHGTQGAASASVRETVDQLTESVVRALVRSRPGGGTFHIEDVQDQVELGLMRGGHHEVARAYVLYRERRAQERARQGERSAVAGTDAARASTAASACRSTWRG